MEEFPRFMECVKEVATSYLVQMRAEWAHASGLSVSRRIGLSWAVTILSIRH
jgi:hypothetical protein